MSKLAFPKPRKKKPRPRRFGLKRSPMKKRRKPVKARNDARRKREFARCYHSEARVRFVKTLACAASGFYGREDYPIDNAHVCDDGTKGASRKSGYKCIAPLLKSVHLLLHRRPDIFAARYPLFNAEQAAAATEAAWQAFRQSHVAVHPK